MLNLISNDTGLMADDTFIRKLTTDNKNESRKDMYK